jgi:membrane protein
MGFIRRYAHLLIEAFSIWNVINAGRIASSIAFFGLLSLAPMLLLIAGIVSSLLPIEQEEFLVELLDGMLGPQAAVVAEAMIAQNSGPDWNSIIIGLISLGTFLWSATTLFSLIKLALDEIWAIPSDHNALFRMARRKATALIVVLLAGLLLTALLAVSTILSRMVIFTGEVTLQVSVSVGDLSGGFVFLTLIAALTFKYIPDFHLAWRDIWGGAMITALATMIAKAPLQYYLNRNTATSVTGVSGTVIVIMFSIYVMALIYLFGAAFVRVYAQRYGSLKDTPYKLPNQR